MLDFARLRQRMEEEKQNFYFVISGDKDFTKSTSIFMEVDDKVTAVLAQDMVAHFCDKLLANKVKAGKKIIVVHADNNGADMLAADYASHKGYQNEMISADWEQFGNRAGWYRNEDLIAIPMRKPDKACVLFWDGEDKFTKNIIYNCYVYGMTLRVYNYKDKRWLKQEEIQQIGAYERQMQLMWKEKGGN